MADSVKSFLDHVTRWAAGRADVLALALVGSHARNAARDDSDVDLVIITRNPQGYLENRRWVGQFGEVRGQQVEPYGPLTSIRVWYAGGLEVEFGITGPSWAGEPLDEVSRRVIAGGMRVLHEREPVLSRHLPADEPGRPEKQ